MNYIINIIKSLEDSNVLIDGITETIKMKQKKQEGEFLPALLAPLAASLVPPVISSIVKGISGRGIRRPERGYKDENFQFSTILKVTLRLLSILITNLDLIAFFQEITYLIQEMERM